MTKLTEYEEKLSKKILRAGESFLYRGNIYDVVHGDISCNVVGKDISCSFKKVVCTSDFSGIPPCTFDRTKQELCFIKREV